MAGPRGAAAAGRAPGALLATACCPTPADPWPACRALLEQVRGGTAVDGVGAGCGGPMEWPQGVVSPLNMPSWRDFPLRERLAQAYPGLPVRVHNDAVCFALGEHRLGAGRGADDLIGVVVSTGVGAGVVVGGRVLDGATGSAGHLGHVVVDPGGPPCGCGGRGCLEAAALLDLRLAVVGGGLSQAGPALWDPLREAVAEHARLPFTAGLQVVPAGLGPEAGLVGAGALVLPGSGAVEGRC